MNLAPYQAARNRRIANAKHIQEGPFSSFIYSDEKDSYNDYTCATSGYVSDITSDSRAFNSEFVKVTNQIPPPLESRHEEEHVSISATPIMSNEPRRNRITASASPMINNGPRQNASLSTSVLPLMKYPVQLTPHPVETQLPVGNLMNINKTLDGRAERAVHLAQRSKRVLEHFKLLKRTESTRKKKKGMQRYLDSVDGIDCVSDSKLERKAKERAVALLHDSDYAVGGYAAYPRDAMISAQTQRLCSFV